jgi:hypothetical protein
MSSRTGLWNLALGIRSPPPAPARPMQDQVLGSSSTSGCYARACLSVKMSRVVGHLLTDGMNALRGRKVPSYLHAKLHTTARKPEHASYPAQMLKLRRTNEFPENVYIGPLYATLRDAHEPPSHSRTFLNPGLWAPTADHRPAPPSPPGQKRPTGQGRPIPIPGRGGLERRRRPAQREPKPPVIVVLVRAGSACHRKPLVRAGHQRARRPDKNPGHRAFTAPASDGQAA